MIAVIRIIGDRLSPPEKRKWERYNEVFLSFWFCFLWFFFSSFYISQHEIKKKVRNWFCEVSSGAQLSF